MFWSTCFFFIRIWSLHIELKKSVWDFYFKALLIFFIIVLTSRAFEQSFYGGHYISSKEEKIENPGHTFRVRYIPNTILHISRKVTEYQPRTNSSNIRSGAKALNHKSHLNCFGASVFVYINAFPRHTYEVI